MNKIGLIIKREYHDTIILNNSAVIQPIVRANNKIPERINNEATKSFPEKPVGDENLDFCSIVSMIND